MNIILAPYRSTFLHLRFPFSFFLLPVFLFALSTANLIFWSKAILAFTILHFLVFPSSNGYNSFNDHDESSIGALRNPPPITQSLFYTTLIMDILAVGLGFFISTFFALLIFLFILVSRAYSYRSIRLKRYPVLSFIIVSVFQGGVVYLASFMAIQNFNTFSFFTSGTLICMAISSLFIGSMYPLTQIYQHQSDKNDGVITISYKLGYVGTFVFASVLFIIATYLVYVYFNSLNEYRYFRLFLIITFPVVVWLLVWFIRVLKNVSQANYSNTMYMNLITALCMNIYFLFLTLNRYGNWY